jgi:PST family polysaccharide transporter
MLAFGGYAATQVISLVTYVILARLLSPAEFGVFAAGSLVTGIGMLFAESGMLAALVTRRESLEQAADTAFVWGVVSGVALSLLSLALAPLVGIVFRSRPAAEVSAALSGVLFLRALGVVPDALLQRRMSFLRRVIIDPLSVLAFAGAAVGASSGGAGVWALVIGTYASMTVRTAGLWLFLRRRPHPRAATLSTWLELTRFARTIVGSEAIRHAVQSIDVVLIGRFVGADPLGQYRYASRFAGLPLGAWVSAAAYVLLPVFTQLADEPPRLRAACRRVMMWMAIGLSPIALLLGALGPATATLLLGPQWREAGWGMMALSGASIGQAIVSIASETFKAIRRPAELLAMHAVAAVASVAFMVALLPLGMLGVAAGVTLGASVAGGYAIVRMSTALGAPVRLLLGVMWRPLLCATLVAGAGYALDSGLVHADRHEAPAGLLILSAEALGLLCVYAALLGIVSPGVRWSVRRRLGRVAA